jgi:AcrR family transcriptional regulator
MPQERGSRKTRRLAPEIRRRQIIDATLQVAEQRGFGSLTVDAIASEAGITRPVVYDLFGDLNGLLAATLQDALDRALVAVDEAVPTEVPDAPPDQVFGEALRKFLEAVRADPLTWRLILLPPQGAPAQIRAAVGRNRAELVGRVAPLIEWALAVTGVKGAEPTVVARLLIATGEDLARLVLESPRRYAPDRIAAEIGALALLLAAAQPPR